MSTWDREPEGGPDQGRSVVPVEAPDKGGPWPWESASRRGNRSLRWFAGVALVAAVAVIGYRLGWVAPGMMASLLQSSSPGSASNSLSSPPPQTLPASQPTSESGRPVARAPEAAEPPAEAPTAAEAVAPPSNEPPKHSAPEVAAMLAGAAQRMANGDVAGARMIYQRLAKEGEAGAALALAETYDPPALRKANVTGGVTSDVALAQSWYEKAKALGSQAAAERLDALTRLDKVTLVTDFGYNGRHAHFFEALDRGYYTDAGLEVKIVRGQGSMDAIHQVGAGNAMFGFIDAGTLVLARAKEQIPVKLVAAVYRKPPQAIFCRDDAGIKKPKDLEGNAIADTAGASIPALFPAFAKAAGFKAENARWVHASIESLPGLLATNKLPCVGQFTLGEALLQSRIGPGAKLVRFAYADAGLRYYGNGIVATAATITSKPDIVRRFVAGTIRGMKDAFADPAGAGAIMHKFVPQVDATIAQKETEAAAELAQIPGQPLGEIDPARIEATLEVVKNGFNLSTPVAAADLYVPGFVSK